MKKIKLTQGKYAIVDDEDYPYLNRFNWCLCNKREAYTSIGETNILMTSFLISGKAGHKRVVMHKNKNSLDCRKCNLIIVNDSVSAHNKKKMKIKNGRKVSSKYKGVHLSKDRSVKGNWRGRITKDNKRYSLGAFKTEYEAAKAYNDKAAELYGKFAYQNKVEQRSEIIKVK